MSLEKAQAFVTRMRGDTTFRSQVEGTSDTESLREELRRRGFDFTERELVGAMASCMAELSQMPGCCPQPEASPEGTNRETSVGEGTSPKLEDLIPLAVVIAAGCEPCAQRMVNRALEQGSTPRHIRKTLALVKEMQNQSCFLDAVGPDAVARMRKPLEAGKRALEVGISERG